MKRIYVIIAGLILLISCSSHNQMLIKESTKDMKFISPAGKTDAERIVAEDECRTRSEEPYYKTGLWLGAAGYSSKAQYLFQDCMAEKGYTCIEDCAYKAEKK